MLPKLDEAAVSTDIMEEVTISTTQYSKASSYQPLSCWYREFNIIAHPIWEGRCNLLCISEGLQLRQLKSLTLSRPDHIIHNA